MMLTRTCDVCGTNTAQSDTIGWFSIEATPISRFATTNPVASVINYKDVCPRCTQAIANAILEVRNTVTAIEKIEI